MTEQEIEVWADETDDSVGERISDVMRRYVPAIIWYPSARHWWCAYRHAWIGRADTKEGALALVHERLADEEGK